MLEVTREKLLISCLIRAREVQDADKLVADLIDALGEFLEQRVIPMWATLLAFEAMTECTRLEAQQRVDAAHTRQGASADALN